MVSQKIIIYQLHSNSKNYKGKGASSVPTYFVPVIKRRASAERTPTAWANKYPSNWVEEILFKKNAPIEIPEWKWDPETFKKTHEIELTMKNMFNAWDNTKCSFSSFFFS